MSDKVQYILAIEDECVAMVLGKINSIGGSLISDDESRLGGKIKIVCEIEITEDKGFSDWLEGNKVSILRKDSLS